MTNPGIPPRNRLELGDAVTNAVAGWVQRELNEQPWYRRKANTITTLGGTVATAVAYLLTSGLELPGWAQVALPGLLLVLTVLGVNVTPNGVTPTTGAQLQKAAKDPAVINAVAVEVMETLGTVHSLDDARRRATDAAQDIGEAVTNTIARHRRGD